MAEKLPDWAVVGAKVVHPASYGQAAYVDEIVRVTPTSAYTKNKFGGKDHRWVYMGWRTVTDRLVAYGTKRSVYDMAFVIDAASEHGKQLVEEAGIAAERAGVDRLYQAWKQKPTAANAIAAGHALLRAAEAQEARAKARQDAKR